MYYSNNAFYYLYQTDTIDNPEQRILQNVDQWCWGTVSFSLKMVQRIISMIAWSIVLYSIASHLVLIVFCVSMVIVFGTIMLLLEK